MTETKNRVEFIDWAKGWVIFLVIWVHTDYPQWVTADFVNAAFFMLSGLFFKKHDFGTFTVKQVNGLLIPFLFFYLLSYPARILFHYWDFRTFDTFDWGCIGDVFLSVARTDYLFINVPLWFLICIFFVRYYYWFICQLPKALLLGLAVGLLMLRSEINSVATPFMMNNALYWLGFFILGTVALKKLIHSEIKMVGGTGDGCSRIGLVLCRASDSFR